VRPGLLSSPRPSPKPGHHGDYLSDNSVSDYLRSIDPQLTSEESPSLNGTHSACSPLAPLFAERTGAPATAVAATGSEPVV
jgi:hypothetical protein